MAAVPDYCTAEQVAEHLLEPALLDNQSRQVLLSSLVSRASRLVDNWFGYRAGAFVAEGAASVRSYEGCGDRYQRVDFMAAIPTKVEVAEAGDLSSFTEWAASEYVLHPINALADGLPYSLLVINHVSGTKLYWPHFSGIPNVRVTAQWGWSLTVPVTITEACIVQVARWFKRGQQAFQDAGAITDLMSLRYLKKLDPEVELLLSRMPGGITI